MPKALTRTERTKIKNFNKIVKASHKVLAKRGLFRATLDEISEVADVGKGTIYNHFKNKMHIISYLTKEALNDLLKQCRKEIAKARDPCEMIAKLIEVHFAFFSKKKALFNLLFFIRATLHQDLENRYLKEIQDCYQEYINFLAERLDWGVKTQAFRPFDRMNQAYILHGIIIGFISQWIINERKGSFTDEIEAVTETFLQGIVAKEKPTKDEISVVSA